ncbi:hypothetical protein A936_01227 [Enterobacter sp. Ag1]|nr:hypothetical protein A936_01227 [Enterobacter sp. Ag1]
MCCEFDIFWEISLIRELFRSPVDLFSRHVYCTVNVSGLNRLRFLSDWPGSGRRERPEAESVGNASQATQDWEIKRRSAASAADLFGRESGFLGE